MGAGDWTVDKVGTGSGNWGFSTAGGDPGGCLSLIGYVGGVGTGSSIDLELTTLGKTFTGSEVYSYEVYREDGRYVNGVVTVQENSGGSFVDIAGSSYLVSSLNTNTWTSKSVSLPTSMGGQSSVKIRLKVINVDILAAFDNLRFDNASVTGGALPVQLVSFSVSPKGFTADLQWSTATEKNNYGFDIERRSVERSEGGGRASEIGGQWAQVGFVQGSGTTTSQKEYSFTDRSVSPGRYAYRIKQIDHDGGFTYYLAAEVEIGVAPKEFTLLQNYPNPFNPATTIEFIPFKTGPARLNVYNVSGQVVGSLFDGSVEGGKVYRVKFDGSWLPSGLYFARLDVGEAKLLRKMLLLK